MRFSGICIISKHVRRLRDFYQAILQVDAEGENVFVALSNAGAPLSIFSYEGMEKMAPGSMVGAGCGSYTIEFEVDDIDKVDAVYDRLLALAAPIVKPPTTQPWGRRSVWCRDPDGNIVNFYCQVEST